MKKLSILALVASIAMIAGVAVANVPGPPVNQDIGFPDVEFSALTEADCRVCHDSGMPDRHHMLYGSAIPDPSVVPNPDADGDGNPDTAYGCLSCHDEDNTGGVINFLVERDCLACHTESPHHTTTGNCVSCHGDIVDDVDDGHYIPTYAPSLVTPNPQAAVCAISGEPCADDSYCTLDMCALKGLPCSVDADCDPDVCEDSKNPCTDNYDCAPGYCSDGTGPCNTDADCTGGGSCRGEEACLTGPDTCVVQGETCGMSATAEPGGCNYCHDAGTDTASGLDILDNHDTHHGKATSCNSCHLSDRHANDMRKCEECHGPESLHNIVADSDDAGTDITVGGENPGYSHVGDASSLPNGDCWGCHGFGAASEPVAGSGVPTIVSVDPIIIAAATPTQVTVTGAVLTTAVPAASSDIRLTAADGSSVTITPDSITVDALTVTINAPAGTYALQAVKDGEASSAIAITVVPDVAIADIMCSKCLGTMTITGVNFAEKPAGTDEVISVTEDGRPLNVISWSDTEITVSGARCRGDVVVEGVFGSSN